ncbi:hypothetical protein [Trinickia acidisoli]|uniref:hypothetical protein n=1 Tax=Trinickia acidisoli TaxID=2767482 RepID=UPI001A903DA5|nr:hypothetical protein [Trinickia acidisoli]
MVGSLALDAPCGLHGVAGESGRGNDIFHHRAVRAASKRARPRYSRAINDLHAFSAASPQVFQHFLLITRGYRANLPVCASVCVNSYKKIPMRSRRFH